MLKRVAEVLVRDLVDHPEAVQVTAEESPQAVTLEVRVAEADMGRVIGRNGRVAKAIRTIVKAAAVKDGRRVNVEFRP
ncbi:MAG TPA: KH domain-containing protein [Symbiobacteriaceae bacterium]